MICQSFPARTCLAFKGINYSASGAFRQCISVFNIFFLFLLFVFVFCFFLFGHPNNYDDVGTFWMTRGPHCD